MHRGAVHGAETIQEGRQHVHAVRAGAREAQPGRHKRWRRTHRPAEQGRPLEDTEQVLPEAGDQTSGVGERTGQ